MKPETADYLGKARQCLHDAKQIAAVMPLYHIVAREAYLAAFHAAEAYLFERSGKPAKTHRGLRGEFGRLARNDPRIDREFLTFLVEAYEYKSTADYGVGPTSRPITAEDARSALATAERFLDCIGGLMSEPQPTPAERFGMPPTSDQIEHDRDQEPEDDYDL